MARYSDYGWRPYVTVAERRQKAAALARKLSSKGRRLTPVEISGRTIARTFWGKAWCQNLEAYSDYANRLPRGRTYVRNGSVIDLQIEAGRLVALVSGSQIYQVEIGIQPLPEARWQAIQSECAGRIESLVELLRGKLSKAVMELVSRKGSGLFPSPGEITLGCSCPDWATMCKHVAAVLYGVGARLDEQPDLLFTLRGVEPAELVATAAVPQPAGDAPLGADQVLADDELADVFGIDLDTGQPAPSAAPSPSPAAEELFDRVLFQLDERQRAIAVERWLAGQSYRAIGEQQGLSAEGARRALAAIYRDHGPAFAGEATQLAQPLIEALDQHPGGIDPAQCESLCGGAGPHAAEALIRLAAADRPTLQIGRHRIKWRG